MNKRGVRGTNAAALVAIIAGLLLLYIFSIPPEMRQELLEDDGGVDDGYTPPSGGISKDIQTLLVKESPGYLTTKLEQTEIQHTLPSLFLRADYRASELLRQSRVYTERGLFSSKEDSVRFTIQDLSRVQDVLLTFTKRGGRGNLRITINDEEVFYGKVSQPTMQPISIPGSILQTDNVMEFEVDGPGIFFWQAHYYDLSNVIVTGSVQDVAALSSSTSFLVTTAEMRSIEQGSLRFLPDCLQSEVGRLQVSLNGQTLLNTLPVCGDLIRKEFFVDKVRTGDNILEFSVDKGSYLIDNIVVNMKTKEPVYQTYYFELDKDQMKDIRKTDVFVNMTLMFASPEFKNLDVFVNGHTLHVDKKGRLYDENVEQFVREGTNSVKLVPVSQEVDVLDLLLRIEERD